MLYGSLQQLVGLRLDYIRKEIIAGVITHSTRLVYLTCGQIHFYACTKITILIQQSNITLLSFQSSLSTVTVNNASAVFTFFSEHLVCFGNVPLLKCHVTFSVSDSSDLEEFQKTTRRVFTTFQCLLRMIDW